MAEMGEAIQLDFNHAMQDFRTMFPDMDADVIEAVLRANRGAVHATIDQLLTMATDVETQKSSLHPSGSHLEPSVGDRSRGLEGASNYELPPSYALSATPPPSYHQAVPSPYRSPARLGSDQTDGKPYRVSKNWNPPILLPLPKDFLRIVPSPNHGVSVLSPQRLSERLSENALAREAVGESDLELAQYLKDERIALFLQNDEFITELRSNQEFMSSLQREHEGDSEVEDDYDYDEGQNYRGRRLNSRRGEGGGNVIPPLDDATFKARIATMGKASRKKFAQIAKVFSRGKRSTGSRSLLPSVGGGTTSANGKDFLMSSDPLIDDFEEDRIQSSSDSILSSSPRMNP